MKTWKLFIPVIGLLLASKYVDTYVDANWGHDDYEEKRDDFNVLMIGFAIYQAAMVYAAVLVFVALALKQIPQ